MAQGEVIKSFLVGLGFDVDDSSLAVFNRSIAERCCARDLPVRRSHCVCRIDGIRFCQDL